MSDLKSISYYSTCENCDTVLEGIGEYHRASDTLYANPCPKCGDEFTVLGWLGEGDE